MIHDQKYRKVDQDMLPDSQLCDLVVVVVDFHLAEHRLMPEVFRWYCWCFF
jgi:hypothetical protein